ncbi:sensor histidine kinase [Oryzifoliimicrobium ureilyticus]|uniref:sensor histidine kinase n=1 Tax=Oryzifoliimicrobium ureilyticus TaxID=3113724 RepID=UPI0030763B09
MRQETGITRRLITWLTSAMVVFWLLAIGLSLRVMQHEFSEIFDSAQQETTQRLLALIVDDMNDKPLLDPRSVAILKSAASREYLTYQLRDRSGKVVLRSNDADSSPFDVPLKAGFANTPTHRIYTEPTSDDAYFMQVADRFKNRWEAVRETAVTLLIPLIVLIPASIFAIWFIVGKALKPIDTLRRDIATKDGGNMGEISTSLPKELRPIAVSVNHLLMRLRAAFEAEREFTANSAHELRTPIAGALAQTQMLMETLPEGAAKDRAHNIETSLVNLGRTAEKLLQLARAEAGIGQSDKAEDLKQVLELMIEDFRRDGGADGRIRYKVRATTELKRHVDIDAFGIVVRNLIENALVHGDQEAPIEVGLDASGVVSISNSCKVVEGIDPESLKKRFRRGKTNAAGSGLGLAISDRMVTQMGGRLEILSPASGRSDGFEARIILPT